MTRRTMLLSLVVVLLSYRVATADDCTIYSSWRNMTEGSEIYLYSFNMASGDLDAAAGYWQTCSNYGQEFPSIGDQPGGIPVSVSFVAGPSTNSNGTCGQTAEALTNGSLTSAEVTIWQTQANGVSCEPYTDVLAHELGHVFGLDNAPSGYCAGTIMGIRDPITNVRSVTGSQCSALNTAWYTDWEREQEEQNYWCQVYGCSPIIIDLDGGGLKLTGTDSPVTFDLHPGGPREQISWTSADSGDGFLYLDRNGNGVVDDGGELFGNSTPLFGGGTASNGYIALAEFDTPALGGNSDGMLDEVDYMFGYLKVWVDGNHNGVSEPFEVRSLADAGVIALELKYHHSGQRDGYGNLLRFRARVWVRNANGQPRVTQSWDVFFQAAP